MPGTQVARGIPGPRIRLHHSHAHYYSQTDDSRDCNSRNIVNIVAPSWSLRITRPIQPVPQSLAFQHQDPSMELVGRFEDHVFYSIWRNIQPVLGMWFFDVTPSGRLCNHSLRSAGLARWRCEAGGFTLTRPHKRVGGGGCGSRADRCNAM